MSLFRTLFGKKPTSLQLSLLSEDQPMKPDLVADLNAAIDRALNRGKARKDRVVELQHQVVTLEGQVSTLTESNTAMARELDRMESEMEAMKAKIDAMEPEVGGSTGDV